MSSCTKKTKSEKGKTLVFCPTGGPSAFNPQIVSDELSSTASSDVIFNRLVEFKEATTEIIPSLAERWEISPDNLSYTFYLRKDVSFHKTEKFTPTRNFNADDVLFSFYRQMDSNHPYHKVSGGNYIYFNDMGLKDIIESVTKKDDYTVAIKLKRSNAPFLANLAMHFMSIHSQEYADTLAKINSMETLDTHPVGTGPFTFQSYVKDSVIRYKANDSYFEGKPTVESLVFAITADNSVRYQKLKTGECHIITEPPITDLEAIRTNPALELKEQESLSIGYMAFNTEKAPLNNLDFRKAVYHALNRNAYLSAVYLNNAVLAQNPYPPSIWGYNDAIVDYPYDVELAKSFLKKSGVSLPVDLTLWSMPVSRPYNPNGKKMAEMMQSDLSKIGINIKIETFDWPTYLSKSKKGEHQLLQIGWMGDNGDPDNFMQVLLSCEAIASGSNMSRFCHEPLNSLLVQAQTEPDVAKRISLYRKAQEVFHEQIPFVPLAHGKKYRGIRKEIGNYIPSLFGERLLHKVTLP